MSQPTSGPMELVEMLDEAILWTRAHLRSILLPTAIPVCIVSAIMVIAQVAFFQGFSGGSTDPDLPRMFLGFAGFGIAVVLTLVLKFLAHFAGAAAAAQAVSGRAVSIAEAWRFVVRPPVLGTLILFSIAVLFGTAFCFFPGIYLGLLFSLVVPVMMFESTFGPDALGRSMDLTGYNPGGALRTHPRFKAFVIALSGFLLGMAISLVIQLPAMVLQQLLMLHSVSSGHAQTPGEMFGKMAWIQVPSTMAGVAVQLLTQLYVSFGIALLYFDLRKRREGTDLVAAIAEMSLPSRAGGGGVGGTE
jgi:hypothetical protein